jgi:hypothetical protein
MNVTYPMCSHEQRPDRRSRPMRGRFAFRVKTARLQATDCGLSGHLMIIKSLLGAIDTRSVASIDTHQGTSTIQIAIAGGTG